MGKSLLCTVSIPFKRENIYQRCWCNWMGGSYCWFQFPSNGKTYINWTQCLEASSTEGFQFPSNGKTYINFHAGHVHFLNEVHKHVSIPFKRENIYQRPQFQPSGPWLQKPKTMSELRRAFFDATFCPKIPQTRVYIELCATFHKKRLRSKAPSAFLGDFCRFYF